MQRITVLWNRGILGKVALIGGGTLGLLVLCCAALLIFVPSTPRTAQNATAAAAATAPTSAPTEAPAATAGSTVTPAPTDIPQPTNTPEPTATPAPTETPEPTATPIPPVELSGRGQTVTEQFTPPGGINRVFFTHEGQSNFIVHVFGSAGSEGTMVNEIGNYQGIRPLIADEDQFYFEVKADGPWTIRIETISGEPEAAQGLEGKGDYMSGLFEPSATGPVPYNVSHDGDANFIVYLCCAGGQDSVQNEIGKVSGSVVVRFSDAPCFWDVRADGNWSLKPK